MIDQNPQKTHSKSQQERDNENNNNYKSHLTENARIPLENGNGIVISQIECENDVVLENMSIQNTILEKDRSRELYTKRAIQRTVRLLAEEKFVMQNVQKYIRHSGD